jgi:hypothetical protein
MKSERAKPIDGEAFFENLLYRENDLLKKNPPKWRRTRVLNSTLVLRKIVRRSGSLSPTIALFRPSEYAKKLRFQNVRDFLIAYAPDESPIVGIVVILWSPQPAHQGGNPARKKIP